MELKDLKINFLGDSITEGAGASSPQKNYVNRVAKRIGAVCRNYGIGGTRIAKQKNPSAVAIYDRDFCSRVDEMDSDADVIVVFGGTNDYGHGDAPLGTMSDRTNDTFYGALHELYIKLISKYPDAYILILTPLHRFNEERLCGDNKPSDVADLKTYVNIIREVAEYYSLPVLDLFASSGISPNHPDMNQKYFADGLHPNDEGHSVVANKIINHLRYN